MNNIFYIGDSVNVIKKKIASESIDAIITSSPYDDLRDYNGFDLDTDAVSKELF